MENTVPLVTAQLAATAGWGPAEVPTVEVGGSREVYLPELPAGQARRLRGYWDRCRQFWNDARTGAARGPWVAVHRPLLSAVQTDSKAAGRRDLRPQLEALESVPGLLPLLDEALSAEPDAAKLAALAELMAGTVEVTPGQVRVQVRLTADAATWSTDLGGPASAGEVARLVHLTTRQAAWRDRRVRRLSAVEVTAEEVWPDPAAA